jgi:probable HAF family extracellular repeat protein
VIGGSFTSGDTEFHGFSWTQSGGMIDLGSLGGAANGAYAVNDRGEVVGNRDSQAFSWTQSGGMIDLGTLGGGISQALAVNASGQVVGSSTTTGDAEQHAVLWQRGSFYLHGSGGIGNPAVLFLDTDAPTGSTPKYKDSPPVSLGGGNPWKAVGTWNTASALTAGLLNNVGDVDVWIGLKNSDDQGTNFDLRIEVLKNATELVAAGELYCIKGVTRNPANAKGVAVPPSSFSPVPFDGGSDVLSLRVLTRIGTGGACGGHSSAIGLRLYFDAVQQDSMIEAVVFEPAAP